MPMHDWTRVKAGTYHDFHQGWAIRLRNRLNAGVLPPEYFAMAEQSIGRPIADVVALHREGPGGGTATLSRPRPATTIVQVETEESRFAARANRIAIHHGLGDVVAVIEFVSPGNKSSRDAIQSFVEKGVDLIRQGVHLLIVDPFPPGPRDPNGVHALIWGEITDQPFELPPGRPLTVVSYDATVPRMAFLEPSVVSQPLPTMPLYLADGVYVDVPLEETYAAEWDGLPAVIRDLFGPGSADVGPG